MKEHRKQYPMWLMSKLLGVSRAGYYHWLKRRISSGTLEDRRLLEIIKFHYNKSKGTYGLPRIYCAIRKEGIKVNKKKIARLMRINNIRAKTKRKFKVTTVQNTKAAASENILRGNFNSKKKTKYGPVI